MVARSSSAVNRIVFRVLVRRLGLISSLRFWRRFFISLVHVGQGMFGCG